MGTVDEISFMNTIRESLVSEKVFCMMTQKYFNNELKNTISFSGIELRIYSYYCISFVFNDQLSYELWQNKSHREWAYMTDDFDYDYFETGDDEFSELIWPKLTNPQKTFVMKHFDIFSQV